jgi:hypothetical protein
MTQQVIPMPRDPHQDIQALLPWYVSDALDPADRADVHAHLVNCAVCRSELDNERRMASAMAALPEPSPSPDVDAGWAALKGRLGQGASNGAAMTAGVRTGRASSTRRPTSQPGWMGWAMAAQFGAIVVLAGLAWRGQPEARYHALSAQPVASTANVVVVFHADAREAELRQALRGAGARLVDGPTSADAYMLHVPDRARVQALQFLRRQPQVVLAEPIDGS